MEIGHELLVLRLIYDSDDLIMLLHAIGTEGLIDGSTTFQLVEDVVTNLLLLGRNDTDAALHIVIEDVVIHDKTIEIRA